MGVPLHAWPTPASLADNPTSDPEGLVRRLLTFSLAELVAQVVDGSPPLPLHDPAS